MALRSSGSISPWTTYTLHTGSQNVGPIYSIGAGHQGGVVYILWNIGNNHELVTAKVKSQLGEWGLKLLQAASDCILDYSIPSFAEYQAIFLAS